MKTILIFLLLTPVLTMAKGNNGDPQGYFRSNKSWSVDDGSGKNNHFIFASSEYRSKPAQKPNKLTVEHRCGVKKIIPMFRMEYCGIDQMQVVDGKLEITFVDFTGKGSKGYCTKKRAQSFKIPPCK